MSHPGESGPHGPGTRHVRFKEILVVEEDETWALALRDALCEGGYRVTLVLSSQHAASAVRQKQPDLLLVSALLGNEASEFLLREIESLRVPPPLLLVGARRGETRWEPWKSLPYATEVRQPFQLVDVLEAARAVLGSAWEDLTGGEDLEASA